jgi:hypothetical protein
VGFATGCSLISCPVFVSLNPMSLTPSPRVVFHREGLLVYAEVRNEALLVLEAKPNSIRKVVSTSIGSHHQSRDRIYEDCGPNACSVPS